jgi:S1-C subfamily serine protease
MADTVADYLDRHPGRRMVVLAGSGHVAFGDGIPSRVARRRPVDSLVVLHDDGAVDDPRAADLWLATDGAALPPAGMLGVFVEPAQPGLRITGFGDDSGARDAGLEEGDLIVAVDGAELDGFADLKIALRDHLAGDRVRLRVRRQGSDGHATDDVEVELR